jgi:hypothetical protein
MAARSGVAEVSESALGVAAAFASASGSLTASAMRSVSLRAKASVLEWVLRSVRRWPKASMMESVPRLGRVSAVVSVPLSALRSVPRLALGWAQPTALC